MHNITLIYFEYSFLFSSVVTLFVCIFTYIKKRNESISLIFSLHSFFVFIWSFGFFMLIRSDSYDKAVFWRWLMENGSVWLPALWLHFIYSLLEVENDSVKKIIIKIGYLTSGILWLINLSDLFGFNYFAIAIEKKSIFNFYPTAGIGYYLFFIFYSAVVIYTLFKLFQFYRKNKIFSFKKQQIKYVFFASVLGFFGGGMTFLLTFNINILPYGIIFFAIYPAIIAYAITKYNLLGIKIFATYFFIGLLNLVGFAHIFFSESAIDYTIEILSFILVLTISYLLQNSFKKEIKQREHLERVSKHLEKANKKLANTAKKLKMLDKAKNEFLSVAAHQLRTPATAVKGYTSMILEGIFGECDEEVKDALNKVYKANERMTNLIEDLLNTSRIEAGNLKYEFAKMKIQDVLEELKNTFIIRAKESKLKFSVKYPKKEPLPEIVADKNKIREVISNIIDNAIKYTPKGSVKITAERENEFVKIIVEDTGRGMTDRTKNNLFEKFTRGQESASDVEGTGLGLFVVKNYVEKHRGTIAAYSDGLDKGSKFVIKLPIERVEDDEDL